MVRLALVIIALLFSASLRAQVVGGTQFTIPDWFEPSFLEIVDESETAR
jgi:hypothetical protein